jgi:hypothetical protein
MAVRLTLASFGNDFEIVNIGTQDLPVGKLTSIARYAKVQNLRSNTLILWQRVCSERRTSSSHPLETKSVSPDVSTGGGYPYHIDHSPSRGTDLKAGVKASGVFNLKYHLLKLTRKLCLEKSFEKSFKKSNERSISKKLTIG